MRRSILGLVLGLLAALPAAAATVTLWNPAPTSTDRGGGSGLEVVAPIRVSPADGVTSMGFDFAYDPIILAPLGVYRTPFTHGFSIASDLSVPGRITVALDGSVPLAGSGDVAWIVFRVNGASGTFSGLSWISASLNGGALPAVASDGRIAVIASASVLSVPSGSQGLPGALVSVPVSAQPADGALGIDIRLVFDPNVITPTTVQQTALTSGMLLTFNLAKPGEAFVSLFQDQPIVGSGPLVNVVFQVVGAIGEGTPVNVVRGDINEQQISTVLGDGIFTVCSGVDADGDGYSGCAGDCDDSSNAIHPGAAEICNGLDDNCNQLVDEGISAPSGTPTLSAAKAGGALVLSWAPVPAATGLDVVKGDLAALRGSAGDFTQATRGCLGNDVPGTSAQDGEDPAAEAGFWYVGRAVNCGGAGSYDSGAPKQKASRDAAIAASSSACP